MQIQMVLPLPIARLLQLGKLSIFWGPLPPQLKRCFFFHRTPDRWQLVLARRVLIMWAR